MSIVLSVYVPNALCEFLLPAVNNTDTEIVLKKNINSTVFTKSSFGHDHIIAVLEIGSHNNTSP